MFSGEFCEMFRNTFFAEHFWVTASACLANLWMNHEMLNRWIVYRGIVNFRPSKFWCLVNFIISSWFKQKISCRFLDFHNKIHHLLLELYPKLNVVFSTSHCEYFIADHAYTNIERQIALYKKYRRLVYIVLPQKLKGEFLDIQ